MKIERFVKIIEKEFEEGKIKQIGWIDLIKKLEKKGYEGIDIEDALDEAERRKIIDIDSGFCKWIDPNNREAEKAKTQKRFQILATIFKEGQVDFIPRKDLEATLKDMGFDDNEILNIIAEASRDHVLRFISRPFSSGTKLVAGCTWIQPRDREKEAKADRHQIEWFKINLEKKAFEEKRWNR